MQAVSQWELLCVPWSRELVQAKVGSKAHGTCVLKEQNRSWLIRRAGCSPRTSTQPVAAGVLRNTLRAGVDEEQPEPVKAAALSRCCEHEGTVRRVRARGVIVNSGNLKRRGLIVLVLTATDLVGFRSQTFGISA